MSDGRGASAWRSRCRSARPDVHGAAERGTRRGASTAPPGHLSLVPITGSPDAIADGVRKREANWAIPSRAGGECWARSRTTACSQRKLEAAPLAPGRWCLLDAGDRASAYPRANGAHAAHRAAHGGGRSLTRTSAEWFRADRVRDADDTEVYERAWPSRARRRRRGHAPFTLSRLLDERRRHRPEPSTVAGTRASRRRSISRRRVRSDGRGVLRLPRHRRESGRERPSPHRRRRSSAERASADRCSTACMSAACRELRIRSSTEGCGRRSPGCRSGQPPTISAITSCMHARSCAARSREAGVPDEIRARARC